MNAQCHSTCSAALHEEIDRVELADATADPSCTCREWNRQLAGLRPHEILAWGADRWPAQIALCTSFQAEGMALLDMVCRSSLPVRVLTLDTGRLPAETYDHMERVRRHYGLDIEVVFPEAGRVEEMVRSSGPNLFYESQPARLRCCEVRKVEPMRRALRPYSAWVAGLRRDQTRERRSIALVEPDRVNGPPGDASRPTLFKLNPIADWSSERVWEYIREKRVPYHPLYDRGYLSIGCAPCTRPSRPQEDPRAGRWWWERDDSRECGLHVIHGGAG